MYDKKNANLISLSLIQKKTPDCQKVGRGACNIILQKAIKIKVTVFNISFQFYGIQTKEIQKYLIENEI